MHVYLCVHVHVHLFMWMGGGDGGECGECEAVCGYVWFSVRAFVCMCTCMRVWVHVCARACVCVFLGGVNTSTSKNVNSNITFARIAECRFRKQN